MMMERVDRDITTIEQQISLLERRKVVLVGVIDILALTANYIHMYQESITIGVYSHETSNDICAWAACTVLLIAVLLLRRATYKMVACAKRR